MSKIVLDDMNSGSTLKKMKSLAMELNEMRREDFAVLGSVRSRAKPSGLKSAYEAEVVFCVVLSQVPCMALYQSLPIHHLPWSSELCIC